MFGIEEGSTKARLILHVANAWKPSTLDLERHVGLTKAATDGIVKYRRGPDGVAHTDDDNEITTLRELDRVKHVGEKSFQKLGTYVDRRFPGVRNVSAEIAAAQQGHPPNTGNPAVDAIIAAAAIAADALAAFGQVLPPVHIVNGTENASQPVGDEATTSTTGRVEIANPVPGRWYVELTARQAVSAAEVTALFGR